MTNRPESGDSMPFRFVFGDLRLGGLFLWSMGCCVFGLVVGWFLWGR